MPELCDSQPCEYPESAEREGLYRVVAGFIPARSTRSWYNFSLPPEYVSDDEDDDDYQSAPVAEKSDDAADDVTGPRVDKVDDVTTAAVDDVTAAETKLDDDQGTHHIGDEPVADEEPASDGLYRVVADFISARS